MAIALYTLTSGLHAEAVKDPSQEPFIQNIEAALGERFDLKGDNYEDYDLNPQRIIYVRTGGTEGLFKDKHIKGTVRLLTSGKSNSLAASMEILSYLIKNGQDGEILHGSAEEIAARLRLAATQARPARSPFLHTLTPIDLGGIRLGVIGRPSDWLISSDVDYNKAKERLNAELVDIPMDELITRVKAIVPAEEDQKTIKGSEAIYDALKSIIKDYRLGGLTLRCFDLLDSVHNTGCLALARLNAEGLPASCEGDVPALLSMAILQKTKGCPGFQCNLSRINGDELLFAHCTIPLTMVKTYRYATHFESAIGTAIKGELPEGQKIEIFKISPDLETYVSIEGRIKENTSEPDLCRTQAIITAPGAASYLLHSPLANHHILSYL